MTKIENHHSFAFKKCKQVTVVVTVISYLEDSLEASEECLSMSGLRDSS